MFSYAANILIMRKDEMQKLTKTFGVAFSV